jgi:hypothetical protein
MQRKVLGLSKFVCAFLILVSFRPEYSQAQSQSALSAMDYIEIQQLVNKFSIALDYCTNGGSDFADLFAADGEFIIDEGDGMPAVYSTHDSLVTLASGPDCDGRLEPPAAYIRHLSEGLVIEPTAAGARGISYAIYPANKGQYFMDDVAGQVGIYVDEFIKTSDGWRFKSRTHATNPVVGELEL